MGKKVVVGMSGGVDSSVAALLLKEQGYEVIGVTMQVWQEEGREQMEEGGGGCLRAVEDARRVAKRLDIPHHVMDFRKEFREYVVDPFMEEYLRGRTPNPCIACNRYVKWESLLHKSLELGADCIATGHYARITQLENGRFAIRSSVTAAKDQTYALYSLTQEQLAHTLMPVGDHPKEEIRRMAREAGLPVAHKKDSQEICFIPDHDHGAFIERERKGDVPGPGNFVSMEGRVLGKHKGIIRYTVGQRKGLDLPLGRPVYVTRICPEKNEVVIGDARDVFSTELTCSRICFMSVPDLQGRKKVTAKIRYAHAGTPCVIERTGEDRIRCAFEEPVRAVTPGQAVVFYEGGYVLGGGVIDG